MVNGGIIKERLESRRSGAKQLANEAVSNMKTLGRDVKERIDLDQNVNGSILVDVPKGVAQRVTGLVSGAEKRFASNNRIGLGR